MTQVDDFGEMMKRLLKHLIFATATLVALAPAMAAESAIAAERGTASDATALVKKVIAYYKVNGKEKTFAAINNQSPDFKYKDLYVFASSALKEGEPLAAHGANPRMVGKNMGELKDADGSPFAKKITQIALSKEGKGWVDYKWPNPVTKAIEPKSTYVERYEDVYFAVGIYK